MEILKRREGGRRRLRAEREQRGLVSRLRAPRRCSPHLPPLSSLPAATAASLQALPLHLYLLPSLVSFLVNFFGRGDTIQITRVSIISNNQVRMEVSTCRTQPLDWLTEDRYKIFSRWLTNYTSAVRTAYALSIFRCGGPGGLMVVGDRKTVLVFSLPRKAKFYIFCFYFLREFFLKVERHNKLINE